MIILCSGTKGGAGKSTIAVNIAVELQRLKYRTMLLDADPQATANDWSQFREECIGKTRIPCVQKFGNLRNTLIDLDEQHDFLIVDTTGADCQEMRTAMATAHILLTPFKPSQPDIATLPKLNMLITAAKDYNENLLSFAFLNMAPPNPMTGEVEEAKEILKEFDAIKLLPVVIRDRKVFRKCMASGLGVVEMNDPKAKAEVQILIQKLFQHIEANKENQNAS